VKRADDDREERFEDDIKPKDGLLRYWTFFNGEQYRLFSALAAATFGVLWCFLYILGAGQTVVGIVLLVLAAICVLARRLLDEQVRDYEKSGWKKDKRSARREKIEIRMAVALWLSICVVIGTIILQQWRHSH
jgi:archaellum biogenesis protein FlaJ (TadC family)